jgi:hypothetical protein
MFTRHGHNIPGTGWDNPPKGGGKLCGGPRHCKDCADDVTAIVGTPKNWPEEAKSILWDHLRTTNQVMSKDPFEIYIVWASKILKNWKGLLATTQADQKYYELTYDGDAKCWYVDDYAKIRNTTYPAR